MSSISSATALRLWRWYNARALLKKRKTKGTDRADAMQTLEPSLWAQPLCHLPFLP